MLGCFLLQLVRADNTWMKQQNLYLVLNVIRENGLVSRAQISKKTGLSRSTVSQLVAYLLEEDIIEEAGSGESIGGRRPILLRIKPNSKMVCAVHVDDDGSVHVQAEDLSGNPVGRDRVWVDNPDELVSKILLAIEGVIQGNFDRLVAIALALPGVISTEGDIISAVNLGWKNVAVGSPLAKILEIPVLGENATGLAAYGELEARGNNVRNLVYLRIGSVVGAGIISDNRLHNGLRGSAAEIGHMVIDAKGPCCPCGRRGCLETKVNRRAVLRLWQQAGGTGRDGDSLTEANVFEWLVDHDNAERPAVQDLLRKVAKDVAVAVVNVLNTVGPEAIVLESRLCDSSTFWTVLEDTVAMETLPFAEGKYELLRSLLGENAVLAGAAAYARAVFFRATA